MTNRFPFGFVEDYWIDAWQRSIMYLDVLRERGNIYFEHKASAAPNVLNFEAELIRDGRTLAQPVNYLLVRIVPPEGASIDTKKPPYVVIDPRAGHGPGIGGMKHDSEIGVAMAAGHPCYFIGFLPEPHPGQTIQDVCRAQAAFMKDVAARHPDAYGKPVIIANCQAGWQTMMMAAIEPEVAGPIMLAGSPLSYWAGVRGKNPLRYLGGVLGGTWLTALAGDLGDGLFDGAHLVANFESLNPAHTHWEKPYNVYSKIDTEAPRFLDFETWWGSPVLLNAEEMQWIADNLFVGNRLSIGALRMSDGMRIDLRNVKSPIIVFCSWGDNITPPQQALDWITDIYDHEREIAVNGQTIIYTLHQSIGHLGIFVSGKIANKEHREFTASMDMINLMPPGLYEAVITGIDKDIANPELVEGGYLFTLEPRTLEDIRALGENSHEDEMRFAAAARLSDVNQGLYRTFAQPAVRAMITKPAAEAIRWAHPNRLRFAVYSDKNPMMGPVASLAKSVRNERKPVPSDNPLLVLEKAYSSWITSAWETYGNLRDAAIEGFFLNTYGSPLLQAMVGLSTGASAGGRRIERDLVREAHEARMLSDLEWRFEVGEPVEAAVRALIYVLRADTSVDERTFAKLKMLRAARPSQNQLTMTELKEVLSEQAMLVRVNEERAVRAIPKLLSDSESERRATLEALRSVVEAKGSLSDEAKRRLARIDAIFNDAPPASPAERAAHA
ncbi:MAG TPA: DUF3141 domain-containing protein [Rhizomicrobium sp.]|nr:DUF3141 domain-containing protein [Rhizomicrobium sp.]